MKPNPVKKSKSVKAWGIKINNKLIPQATRTKDQIYTWFPNTLQDGGEVVRVLITPLPLKSVVKKGKK